MNQKLENLIAVAPLPWHIEDDGFSGWIVDATGRKIFGGEPCEGRISRNDTRAQALIQFLNSLVE